MNKFLLIFAALAVVSIGGVPMSVDESDQSFEEVKKFLTTFCADLLNGDSEDEKQDNEIGDWGWDDEDEDYRKKRDLSEDGIGLDMEVLASKDGPTLMGIGLGMACVGNFKHELEQFDDLLKGSDRNGLVRTMKIWSGLAWTGLVWSGPSISDQTKFFTEEKRRKRRFVKRSVSSTSTKKNK